MQRRVLHLRKLLLTLIVAILYLPAYAQPANNLRRDADTLKMLLSRADTLSRFRGNVPDVADTIDTINEAIGQRLVRILQNPAITKQKPDVLLAHPALGITHSNDNRLWIFNWNENTGGSWRRNLNVIHYRTAVNKPRADYDRPPTNNEVQNDFYSSAASYYKIYKLRSPKSNLYLCLGDGISCNTCVYRIAYVIELTPDSINYEYLAFLTSSGYETAPYKKYHPPWRVDGRMDDIKEFSFDPKTQTLHAIRRRGDLISNEDNSKGLLRDKWTFDGRHFR